MRDEIEEIVERLAARGASKREIWDALLGLDHKWNRKRSRLLRERQERTRMLGRLGQLLHYFHHGYPGGTLLRMTYA